MQQGQKIYKRKKRGSPRSLSHSLTRSLAHRYTANAAQVLLFSQHQINECSLPSSSQMLTHPTGSFAYLLNHALTSFETWISDSFRYASFTERTLSRRAIFVRHKWLTKKYAPSHKARSRMFPSSTLATLEIE